MPVTDQQLRAIAFLASACRPIGCKAWDETGILANVTKVRDRSLGSVIIAAVQAAEDRNAVTPGVIPSAGPHWRTPDAAPVTSADKINPGEHCAGCGKAEHVCRARLESQRGMDPEDPRYDDHAFVTVAAARGMKRDGATVAQIAAAVKEQIAPTAEPDQRKTLDDLLPDQHDPRVEAARADLTATQRPPRALGDRPTSEETL